MCGEGNHQRSPGYLESRTHTTWALHPSCFSPQDCHNKAGRVRACPLHPAGSYAVPAMSSRGSLVAAGLRQGSIVSLADQMGN